MSNSISKFLLAYILIPLTLIAGCNGCVGLVVLMAGDVKRGGDQCNISPDPSQVLEGAKGIKIKGRPINGEQVGNANTIIRVGIARKASPLKIKLALMVAIQESGLINLHYGDRDSLGLFQQRSGWGSVAQRLDPTHSSTAFYNALDKVPGAEGKLRQGKFLEVALKVQRPDPAAYLSPDNYFPGWASVADALLGKAGIQRSKLPVQDPCTGGKGDASIAAIIQAADQLDGMRVPYNYGAGHVTPAKPGPGQQGSYDGLDCSSSVSWVLQHAGFHIPTLDSTGFMSWGDPGKGQYVTIYANEGHVFMGIRTPKGFRYFGTSGFGHPSQGAGRVGHGPAWFEEGHAPSESYLSAFVKRHPPGM